MNEISSICRLLGSFFYSPLTGEQNQHAIAQLRQNLPHLNAEFAPFILATEKDDPETLNRDFFLLFEGAEAMVAPPWGSVYLNQENLMFGESTIHYCTFLKKHNVVLDTGIKEPADQFGLMLMAISQLIETQRDESTLRELLSIHLFTWCFRYLELVRLHATTEAYQALADLAYSWCLSMKEDLNVEVEAVVALYR